MMACSHPCGSARVCCSTARLRQLHCKRNDCSRYIGRASPAASPTDAAPRRPCDAAGVIQEIIILWLYIYPAIHIYIYMFIVIVIDIIMFIFKVQYLYIYIYRERNRCTHTHSYIYIYRYTHIHHSISIHIPSPSWQAGFLLVVLVQNHEPPQRPLFLCGLVRLLELRSDKVHVVWPLVHG